MAQRRETIASGVGSGAILDPNRDVSMGEWAALQASYAFEEAAKGTTYRNYWALALVNPSFGVEIDWLSDRPEPDAGARFDALLQSVSSAEEDRGEADIPGMLRHQARFITLAVPAAFTPPRTYYFTDSEEQATLYVTFARLQDLDSESDSGAEVQDRLGVSTPVTRSIERDTAQKVPKYAIYKATLPLSEQCAAILTGRASFALADELETKFAALLRSLKRAI